MTGKLYGVYCVRVMVTMKFRLARILSISLKVEIFTLAIVIYQGADAEVIKEALRLVLQEKRKAERPRNEKLLLQAVKGEVVARLKQSLHNAVLINLGKEAQPEQVKRPWSSDIKIGDKPSEPIPYDRSILDVFEQEEIAGKLLILGNPGAGKTTTMLDLAKALIARAEQDADYPIPVWSAEGYWCKVGG